MKIKKCLFFDFDGVILDSLEVKANAFAELFSSFENELVSRFIQYHYENGGVSRFKKIKYFYNDLLKITIKDDDVASLANDYSDIVRSRLMCKKLLIDSTMNFIRQNHSLYAMHIVSASEHFELLYLCEWLNIKKYFLTINGSPKEKHHIIHELIMNSNYRTEDCVLIGDSRFDLIAARANGISFYGFNNEDLRHISDFYIDDYRRLNAGS